MALARVAASGSDVVSRIFNQRIIAFKGVRSSCETRARKSSFARSAASARSRNRRSSAYKASRSYLGLLARGDVPRQTDAVERLTVLIAVDPASVRKPMHRSIRPEHTKLFHIILSSRVARAMVSATRSRSSGWTAFKNCS